VSESGSARGIPRVQPVRGAVLSSATGPYGGSAGKKLGLEVRVDYLPDPRVEAEDRYYNAKHSKLLELRLKPCLPSESLMNIALRHRDRIDTFTMMPRANWREPHNDRRRQATSGVGPLTSGLELLVASIKSSKGVPRSARSVKTPVEHNKHLE
jgi:hypothetical protein